MYVIPLLKTVTWLSISIRVKAKSYILYMARDFSHLPDLNNHSFPCSLFLDAISFTLFYICFCHRVFILAILSANNGILIANSFLSFVSMLESHHSGAFLTTLFKTATYHSSESSYSQSYLPGTTFLWDI